MSQFPPLLDVQRRALFEIVEIFRKHGLEGRAVIVDLPPSYDTRLIFYVGSGSQELVDTDVDTLRVLEQAGYVILTDMSTQLSVGSPWVHYTVILKRLASDYYNWWHTPSWYKPVAERWFSLAPDTRSAIVGGVSGAVMAYVLAGLGLLLGLLIRSCLSN
jgi:hypothetical protein